MNALPPNPLTIRTTCPYCGVGCGVLAAPDGKGGAAIAGDPSHPANFGKLCSKGIALGETLSLDDRLLTPMLRQADGTFARADWDQALGRTADGFRRIIARDGPDAVAFYLSGQLLTEDYYVANKLMKGFIGSANVDTNSRLCMASSVAGHRRAFGSDTVPGNYEDLDQADLIVLVGSNAAWCHPVLFQRMMQNRRERGARLVVIDPRKTSTAEDADLFLPIAPGTDTALFCGLLAHLAQSGAFDATYVDAHTAGFDASLSRAGEIAPDIAATATACGLDEQDVARFFELFTGTTNTVTCFSQGVNQSAQGTDKVNAIINCHLVTGRIGKPGMGPFSLTGQPNAMGGREVGGLANQLAAHMGFSPTEVDCVRRFWDAPRMAEREGLKAVQMFEAIEQGKIKALWVMATNPAVSLPRAGAMREALRKLELFVVSENVLSNDTVNAGAHILLPAAAWGEKDGTVTNSERRVSRQRAFLPFPGEAKPDWWIVTEVARRMGFAEAFPYQSAADIFREHAALSAFENDGRRGFDIGGVATITDDSFAAFDPFQWPLRKDGKGEKRMFGDGRFFTPDRKAKFVAPETPSPRESLSDAYPFRLNTGRVRDQWHTMTRTGRSPRLSAHLPEPFVEVNATDAQKSGLTDNEFAEVTTRHARCVFRVKVSAGQRQGSLFAPIHWSGENSSLGRTGDLVAPFNDPFSGQPEAKATPAAIAPADFALRGFVLSRRTLNLPEGSWWTRIAVRDGFGYVFAANSDTTIWQDTIRNAAVTGAEWIEYADATSSVYRACTLHNGRLDLCLFAGPAASMPDWDHLKALFAAPALDDVERRHLLSGKATDQAANAGPLVCACFGVGINTIRKAIASGAATSVEEIGKALHAGTNCGSCIPEMKKLLAQTVLEGQGHDRLAHTA